MPVLAHAFDVEASRRRVGPRGLMSVAAVCLDIPTSRKRDRASQAQVIDTFFGVIEWPEGLLQDDEYTRKFWEENLEAWKASTEGGEPPETVAAKLWEHIKRVRETADKRQAHYKVVTDNGFYDPGWIDWFLSTYGPEEAMPLQIHHATGYISRKSKVDVSQRYEALWEAGLRHEPFRPEKYGCGDKLAHHPLHDATMIARKYEHYRNVIML